MSHRAPASSTEAAAAVANFLQSLQGNQALASQRSNPQGKMFPTLPDLLPPSSTIPVIDSASQSLVDNLLTHLPPSLLLFAQEANDVSSVDVTSETAEAALEALSLDQKRAILRKVLRSPQFTQSLGSLTIALRDGGLPSISEALKIKVENGGFMPRRGVPFGGGDAVEAFLNGIRLSVEEESSGEEDRMDRIEK